MTEVADHPAPFSDAILPVVASYLAPGSLVLDPFAGIGRIHGVAEAARVMTVGVEIEPEWATAHPRTIVGNALALPAWWTGCFDAVATSPCMEQSHLILTADLRWVPAGDIEVGDEVMAFDEKSPGVKVNGHAARRKWQRATVMRSVPKRVRCVRVWLDNGESLLTTPDHPWLAEKYRYGSSAATWVPSRDLAGSFVLRQMEPWTTQTTYDAGWLAGMLDGEGSLSLGQHGAPKLTACQVFGPVMDRMETLMTEYGYKPTLIERKSVPAHRQPIQNIYVGGGIPGIMRALGELRPVRLLEKWATLDLSTRTIQPWKHQVVCVEDAGERDIQEIETSTGTYIAEGYLMHNCYANRMADSHNAQERCRACRGTGRHPDSWTWETSVPCIKCSGEGRRKYRRITYTHYLGRKLHPDNSGQMQWGRAYRHFHERAWAEVWRVLRRPMPWLDPKSPKFILNISDHVRAHQVVPVVDWHIRCCEKLGFVVVDQQEVKTPRMGYGANRDARVECEVVVVFEKQAA